MARAEHSPTLKSGSITFLLPEPPDRLPPSTWRFTPEVSSSLEPAHFGKSGQMTPYYRGATFCLVAVLALAYPSRGAETPRPLSFVDDVVPVLTKASCNSGGCHAKAGNGQNGFRLSLLGFEPREDYEHIVKEGHGRRVFPASPEQSLLLLKATNVVPHGGGKRLDPASEIYKRLVRWVGEGMVYGKETDPKLVSIEVRPKRNVMKTHGE